MKDPFINKRQIPGSDREAFDSFHGRRYGFTGDGGVGKEEDEMVEVPLVNEIKC